MRGPVRGLGEFEESLGVLCGLSYGHDGHDEQSDQQRDAPDRQAGYGCLQSADSALDVVGARGEDDAGPPGGTGIGRDAGQRFNHASTVTGDGGIFVRPALDG